ncbi:hypothetical protein DPMN_150086 [Dreissena polymorpha]|uniref:Uncharacterized protein n=1 Tax=Dreissena polymorpha TaxID=45954 RepID=A0A9D4FIM8_DREPO|nr:hypothetical protein DPMN_150086 [Dreissena polymorpha]
MFSIGEEASNSSPKHSTPAQQPVKPPPPGATHCKLWLGHSGVVDTVSSLPLLVAGSYGACIQCNCSLFDKSNKLGTL